MPSHIPLEGILKRHSAVTGWILRFLTLDAYTGHLNDFSIRRTRPQELHLCLHRASRAILPGGTSLLFPVTRPSIQWSIPTGVQIPAIKRLLFQASSALVPVFQSAAVQPVLIGSEEFPGQNVTTDREFLDMIKSSSDTIHHAAGTNCMGMVNDSMCSIPKYV